MSTSSIAEPDLLESGGMGNLPVHKPEKIRETIKKVGAELRFLAAYSTDLNPIENSIATIKAYLRKHKERTIPALYDRIGTAIDLISRKECVNYFRNA